MHCHRCFLRGGGVVVGVPPLHRREERRRDDSHHRERHRDLSSTFLAQTPLDSKREGLQGDGESGSNAASRPHCPQHRQIPQDHVPYAVLP